MWNGALALFRGVRTNAAISRTGLSRSLRAAYKALSGLRKEDNGRTAALSCAVFQSLRCNQLAVCCGIKGINRCHFGISESHCHKLAVGVINLEACACIRNGIACFRIFLYDFDIAFKIRIVDEKGVEKLDGMRFLDWPSSNSLESIHAGLQALLVMAMDASYELCNILGETELANEAEKLAKKMRKAVPAVRKQYLKSMKDPSAPGAKQGAALMVLANLMDAKEADQHIISVNGAHGFSTFYGYYMLKAMAKAGDYKGGLDIIRTYWGAMLDLGATTFWEDFDLNWLPNAARIDEIVPEGKNDIHRDFGAYCYQKFRHSFCHGWASGPTSWLSEYVLGVQVVEPGCKVIRIVPHLGDLKWVKGTFPTPYGIISISHTLSDNGKIVTEVDAPSEVLVLRE